MNDISYPLISNENEPQPWIALLLIVAGAFVVCLIFQFSIDRPIVEWSRGIEGTPLFVLSSYLTDLGKAEGYLIVSAVLIPIFWFTSCYLRAAQSTYVFLCVAVSGILADLLKYVFARPRPKLFFSDGLYGFHWFRHGHDWNSFPSGHATTMGALVASLVILFPSARIPIIIIGTLIAATRFIIHAHYLSDVVMAYVLGACTSVAIKAVFYSRNIKLKYRERGFT